MPAPSPITNPSRAWSHGREARGRIVVEPGRQCPRRGKSGDAEPADRRFGAAAHHDVGVVEHNQPAGVADRMGAGRARGHHRMVRPAEAIADRNMAGGEVDQIGRDEKRRQTARPALLQGEPALGDAGQAADAGADHDPGALALILALGRPLGILDRLGGGGHRIDDKAVHLALVLGRDPVIGVEQPGGGFAARHLGGNPRRQVGDIEGLDRAHPRSPGDQALPVALEADAEGRHQPHAGHDDASHPVLMAGQRVEGSRGSGPLWAIGGAGRRQERRRRLSCALR